MTLCYNFVFLYTVNSCSTEKKIKRCKIVSFSVMSDSLDSMDHSRPGSSVHGISQTRILEWVTISFSRESSWPRDQTLVSCIADGFLTTEPPGTPPKDVMLLSKLFILMSINWNSAVMLLKHLFTIHSVQSATQTCLKV